MYECEIIKNNMELSIENTDTLAAVLFVLRLWLLKQKDPELWKRVLSLESHLNKRRNTIVWEDREINIVNVSDIKNNNKKNMIILIFNNNNDIFSFLDLIIGPKIIKFCS